MKNWEKVLTLAFFIWLMTSCGVCRPNSSACHKNIIKQIGNNGWLIEDVVTHQKRIIELNDKRICRSFVEHTYPGDTILVRTPGYEERLVLQTDISTVIYFNYDTIIYRQNKAEFEAKKQQMFNTNTK